MHDVQATTTTIRGRGIPAAARRTAWLAWSAFLLAFAILEGVNHGAAAWAALAGGLIAPDLTFLAAAGAREPAVRGQLPRRAVPLYNTAHRTWIPLALTAAYTVAPLDIPALLDAEGPEALTMRRIAAFSVSRRPRCTSTSPTKPPWRPWW